MLIICSVVLDDLEFQLTLQTKMEQPPPPTPIKPAARAPPPPKPKEKKSAFSKFLPSARRKKQAAEEEAAEQRRQQAAAAAASAARQISPPKPQTPYELYKTIAGRDGSFARSYISLKDFEQHAYGRPYTCDVPCFNEWAVDAASVKSKKGVQLVQQARKPPYKIGKLELQLFFVPRPRGCTDKDMPKSMNAAIRELKEADAVVNRTHEGVLSQQGGDCPFWRRRYFKLAGSVLTAYHEVTHQPRATIKLEKAAKLIYDRNSLVDPTVQGPGKSRRKSGFSEEEEGFMFVDEGFRIRFSNGEAIDFYADSKQEKSDWIAVLSETIGRVSESRGWTQLVLQKEQKRKQEAEKAQAAARRATGGGRLSTGGRQSTGGTPRPSVGGQRPGSGDRPVPQPRPQSYAGPAARQNGGANRMSMQGPHTTGNRMSQGPFSPNTPATRRPPVNFR